MRFRGAAGPALGTRLAVAALLAFPLCSWAEGGDDEPLPPKTEASVLPGAAYDSNLGVGFGLVGDLVRFDPDYAPYKARVAAQVFFYLGGNPSGGVRVTYQHHYLKVDLPGLLDGRLRLRFVGRYRQQINVGYYGIGNASEDLRPWEEIDRDAAPERWAVARRRNEYGFKKPEIGAEARLQLTGPLSAYGAARLWWTWVDVVPESKLADDLASADPNLQRFLMAAGRHGVFEAAGGLIVDTRDNEIAPNRGMYHEVSLRGGPTFETQGGYGAVHANARFYATLLEDWVVLAGRVMADALFGRPPFLELSRYGGQWPDYGPGGAVSVRGVPLQRYHGKIKVMGNLEVRTTLIRVKRFLGRSASLGLLGFVDVGRVWADWTPQPGLDGADLGLALGLGGGLRIRWGGAFMVRADVGVSPDGVGVYFDVNHIF